MNPATTEQPAPKGTGADIARLVQADIEARAQKGEATYGERLRAHNGRDALVDAYQERLDDVMYTRQMIEEREDLRAEVERLRADLQAEQSRRAYLEGQEKALWKCFHHWQERFGQLYDAYRRAGGNEEALSALVAFLKAKDDPPEYAIKTREELRERADAADALLLDVVDFLDTLSWDNPKCEAAEEHRFLLSRIAAHLTAGPARP
jgi:chromosome segregation ATPase